jgi:hypothetical protein
MAEELHYIFWFVCIQFVTNFAAILMEKILVIPNYPRVCGQHHFIFRRTFRFVLQDEQPFTEKNPSAGGCDCLLYAPSILCLLAMASAPTTAFFPHWPV